MLPKADHFPSHFPKLSMVFFVPFSVFGNFLLPEIGYLVFPSRESVSMPEIAVYENGDPGSTKDDVRSAGKLFDMLSEPEPPLMKLGANAYLQSRIFSFDPGHAVASLLGCQVIPHQLTSRAKRHLISYVNHGILLLRPCRRIL